MFGSQVLDVGIGLAMLFAFMSLIATVLNEAIEAFLKVRAQQLEQGIRNMLDDPGGSQLTEKFYNNPLISILYSSDSYKASDLAPSKLNLSRQRDTPPADVRVLSMPRAVRASFPSYIPAESFALTVLTMAAGGNPPTRSAEILKTLDAALAESAQLKGVVMQALASGQGDLEATRKFLEDWYDAAMDRVSGWYKRRAQKILFFIGLFAAVVLNVDTITVARSLITDPALRQSVVNHAADRGGSNGVDFETSSKAVDFEKKALMLVGYPIGWTNLPQLELAFESDKAVLHQSKPLEPIHPCVARQCIADLFADSEINWIDVVPSMILGWLITALAITLGAPFWFDVLSNIMQIRSTTKPASPPVATNGQQGSTPPSADKSNPSRVDASRVSAPFEGDTYLAVHATPPDVMSVSDIQAALNKILTLKPSLAVDGDYGEETTAAVAAFQKAQDLDVDGWVGPKTTAALKLALKIV